MMSQRCQNIVALRSGYNRRIMQPFFPGTPFAEERDTAPIQCFDEFDVVVRNFRRSEYLSHLRGGFRRNEAVLFQQQVKPKQLPDSRGVGIIADRRPDAFTGFAVMFANPEAATALRVVQMI